MKELYFQRSANTSVWVGEQDRPEPFPIVTETFIKCNGYLKHQVRSWQKFKPYLLPDIELSCRLSGVKSIRPYQPGQGCDGSIDAPVLFLLKDFCDRQGFNTSNLYLQCYGHDQQWPEVLAFAKWQGVDVPFKWDQSSYNLLIQSLTNVNKSSLVEKLIQRTNFENPFST